MYAHDWVSGGVIRGRRGRVFEVFRCQQCDELLADPLDDLIEFTKRFVIRTRGMPREGIERDPWYRYPPADWAGGCARPPVPEP